MGSGFLTRTTILAPRAEGFDNRSGFHEGLQSDSAICPTVKLIAELGLGSGAYQVRQHFLPVAEWNDKYRERCCSANSCGASSLVPARGKLRIGPLFNTKALVGEY